MLGGGWGTQRAGLLHDCQIIPAATGGGPCGPPQVPVVPHTTEVRSLMIHPLGPEVMLHGPIRLWEERKTNGLLFQ